MAYKPLILVDDDNPDQLMLFRLKSVESNVTVETFETWDLTKEFIQKNQEQIDGVILDARGKINADKGASDAHLFEAFSFVQGKMIPYAIFTAFTKELPMLEEQLAYGKVFTKGVHKEEEVFDYLKDQIQELPKFKIINQYPEPFQCFGGKYLDKTYETLLLNIISVFQDQDLNDPQNLLFNPCRIILEQVFKKITDTDNMILPYALLQFEQQKAGLSNCFKHIMVYHIIKARQNRIHPNI